MRQGTGGIVVIGGANTDILGFSAGTLVAADSNPGRVRTSAGGVGRNIAENLAHLGVAVELVSAFGSDPASTLLAEECRAAGIGIGHSLFVPGAIGSVYLAIHDDVGEMALALSDMDILSFLTPGEVAARLADIGEVSLVVLDANIPEDTIAALLLETGAPMLAECVSVAKAPRIASGLERLAALTCNVHEAQALLGGDEIRTPDQAARAAHELHARGVDRVFLTQGSGGVTFCGSDVSGHLAAPSGRVVNATGAGDAFCAGAAWAITSGMDTAECAACGTALAALALGSAATVAPSIDAGRIRATARGLLE